MMFGKNSAGMRGFRMLGLCAAVLVLSACDGGSSLTQEQGEQILAELKAMNEKLDKLDAAKPAARPRAPQRVSMELKGGQRMGDPKAPLVMVEFFDYECPFCKRFADQSLPSLKRDFIDTGKLLYVAQDLPLAFHKQARDAAMAGHCAGDQDQFWAYRDHMVANIKALKREDLIGYATELGLNTEQFSECLSKGKYAAEVERSRKLATSLGITGTPAFVIAKNTGSKIEGEKIVGAKPYKAFSSKINALHGSLKKTK